MKYASRVLSASSILLLGMPGVCTAQSYDFYLGANTGMAVLEDADARVAGLPDATVDYDFDSGLALSAAVGAADGPYRSELEIYRQTNDLGQVRATGAGFDPSGANASGDLEVLLGMINAYYDFETGSRVRPYLTAGLGYARIDAAFAVEGFDEVSLIDQENGLAWQLGLGIGIEVGGGFTLDFRYRYLSGDDVDFDTAETGLSGHTVTAGVRFYLP